MRPRSLWLLALVFVVAGCAQPGKPSTPTESEPPVTTGQDWVAIGCRLLAEDQTPIPGSSCQYDFPSVQLKKTTDANGYATQAVKAGESGHVFGHASGRYTKSVALVANNPKSVEMVLEKADGVGPSPTPTSPGAPPTTPPTTSYAPTTGPPIPGPAVFRTWAAPVKVQTGQNEPHLAVDGDGRIFYAPTTVLFRSVDGGKTFQSITPPITSALPSLGSDNSLSLAPDGTVWWARYWGYLGTTQVCWSTNHGAGWTCDNLAVPGVTDRMWVAGLSATDAYIQAGEGLQYSVWGRFTAGMKFVPLSVTSRITQMGNMVYDAKNGAVRQITDHEHDLVRVDSAQPSMPFQNPAGFDGKDTFAISNLAVHDGVLWTTAEPKAGDGSLSIVAARSTDGGTTWTQFPVSHAPKTASFSAISAGPDGRVAVAYYGTDQAGFPEDVNAKWSLYVAETDDGNSQYPTWVETRLVETVHNGNLCVGVGLSGGPCAMQGGGDPPGRFSGDFIGSWIDKTGDIHIAYCQDIDPNGPHNMFLRQSH